MVIRKLLQFAALFACLFTVFGQEETLHTFANADGKTLQDRIVKYDFEKEQVTLEKNGSVPLSTFCEADRKYILHWNQIQGFTSTMRFKMDVEKKSWARMNHNQNITPYYMDAIKIPGKKTLSHNVLMLEEYQETTSLFFEAEGYILKLKNQNFFPVENITVESKVFYEQEYYAISDGMFASTEKTYEDTSVTNLMRFSSEIIPLIVPREEVLAYSDCAITVEHQLDRTAMTSTTTVETGGGEGEEGEGTEEMTEAEEIVEGFGEWDDHGRRRKGKVLGVWFRVGIEGLDGKMIWREITQPSSLAEKITWESGFSETGESTEPAGSASSTNETTSAES